MLTVSTATYENLLLAIACVHRRIQSCLPSFAFPTVHAIFLGIYQVLVTWLRRSRHETSLGP